MSLPSVMSGMVLTGHGGLDRLAWRDDLPVPTPTRNEVLIRVGASAVNNTDINTRIGWYSKAVRGDTASGTGDTGYGDAGENGGWNGALSFPRIQGADVCGTIVAVGTGVDSARIGQRVMVRPMHHPENAANPDDLFTFGSERDGGFAQYTTAASADAIAVDAPLSDLELASFPCAFSTAEGMLHRAQVGAERVLITGASGGVGSAAVQLAKRRGAHVTAVTSAAKAADVIALGADATLGRDENIPDQGFDVIIDLVGGPRWPQLFDGLAVRGRYVTSGAIAGPIVELDLRSLYLRDITMIGSTRQDDAVFTNLIRYIEAGEIRPVLAATYDLKDLHVAQEAFLAKTHIGKIGIRVAVSDPI